MPKDASDDTTRSYRVEIVPPGTVVGVANTETGTPKVVNDANGITSDGVFYCTQFMLEALVKKYSKPTE